MHHIYVLQDPRNKEVRYVGKTMYPAKRLKAHCNSEKGTTAARWIKELKDEGFLPLMTVVESGLNENTWPEREIHWIEHFRKQGVGILNVSNGGHPQKTNGLNSVQKPFQMLIEDDLFQKAQEAARMEGRSLAGFIRQLITAKLKELGK